MHKDLLGRAVATLHEQCSTNHGAHRRHFRVVNGLAPVVVAEHLGILVVLEVIPEDIGVLL